MVVDQSSILFIYNIRGVRSFVFRFEDESIKELFMDLYLKEEDVLKRFELAKEIAKKAGRYLIDHENLRHEIHTKAENDYVTAADKGSENLIESMIKSSFPTDSILGEETGFYQVGTTKSRWIVDPIDGTVNFMTGFPNYTISIAFENNGELAFGVVYVVRHDEMFSALTGNGAFLNDVPIHTDEESPLEKQLALLVPPHRHHEILDDYIVKMRMFYNYVSDVRSIGSAACSLCYVASGRCALYYERSLNIYDVAAGIVIVREAGGQVTTPNDDEKCIDIIASSTFCHDKVVGIVND